MLQQSKTKFVVIINILETNPLSREYLTAEMKTTKNISESIIFDKKSTADLQLKVLNQSNLFPNNKYAKPAVFPVIQTIEVKYTPDWESAYKMLSKQPYC